MDLDDGSEFQANQIYLLGLVSAYMANRATGEVLPGLCVVRDLAHLHKTIDLFQSIEDARAKEQELASKPPSENPPEPPSPAS